jgi:hypothetical protein
MATLIPGIGGCTFDTGGERRFAERLEAKPLSVAIRESVVSGVAESLVVA